MMRLLPIMFLGLISVSSADEASPSPLRDGVELFEKAYDAWDAATFARATALLRQASTSASSERTKALYWLGVSEFHRMLCLQTPPVSSADEKAASQRMQAAIDAFKELLKRAPTHAEGHALLGTLYGMKIDGNLFRAIRYGPSVQKHQKAALRYGPNNPRVHYLLGVGLFNTADNTREFENARRTLRHANELFEKAQPPPSEALEPHWGHGDCLAFLGQVEERLGHKAEAEKAFRRALEVHQGHLLAREGLRRLGLTP